MNELLAGRLIEEWANQSLPRSKERKTSMTVTLKTNPTGHYLELGGGACPLVRPNVDCRQCYDSSGTAMVDVVADFEKPLPFGDAEFDGVFSKYCLEHISYPHTLNFLKEIQRILIPRGKVVLVTANTQAQLEWIRTHCSVGSDNGGVGWDGKDLFTSASELLFGTLDYPENSHKAFFSPEILHWLLEQAGFEKINIAPYNERDTDLTIEAFKPVEIEEPKQQVNKVEGGYQIISSGLFPGCGEFLGRTKGEAAVVDERKTDVIPAPNVFGTNVEKSPVVSGMTSASRIHESGTIPTLSREQLFDKHYFNGGGKVGGYAREGYRDFPVHEITTQHILSRRPESVLEIGAARGYILKRLQDRGIRVAGLEVSRHCYLSRVTDDIFLHDICQTPWPIPDQSFDCCFSIATMEHIPEDRLPAVLAEIKRTCKWGLHGIDFGEKDDGFDKTHCTLKPRAWWNKIFHEHGLFATNMAHHAIVSKEELEQGKFPEEVLKGDGRCKLNLGCYTNMYHQGWVNIDQHDLIGFAQQQGYQFQRLDIRQGLPFATGSVDLIHMSHFLEHLSAKEGLDCLKECRRVIKPDGAIRIACPDTELLVHKYAKGTLDDFSEVSDGAEGSPTQAGKLWELLFSGHQMAYDKLTICQALEKAGFIPHPTYFRKTGAGKAGEQILRETLEIVQCLTCFVDATPLLG